MNDMITSADELDALLQAVSEKATAAVLHSPGSLRPWIITEDDRGNYWAESFLVDVDDENAMDPHDLALPLTVLFRPDAEPAVQIGRAALSLAWSEAVNKTLRKHKLGWEERVAVCKCGVRLGDSIDERWHLANMTAAEVADAFLALLPGRTEAEVALEARIAELNALADDIDREAAEQAARYRKNDVRCCVRGCDLRWEERQEYSCYIPGTGHDYDERELAEAAKVVIEPTYDAQEIRARAVRLVGGERL